MDKIRYIVVLALLFFLVGGAYAFTNDCDALTANSHDSVSLNTAKSISTADDIKADGSKLVVGTDDNNVQNEELPVKDANETAAENAAFADLVNQIIQEFKRMSNMTADEYFAEQHNSSDNSPTEPQSPSSEESKVPSVPYSQSDIINSSS